MARTFEQIKASVVADKESRPELAVLNSTSATAIWRLYVDVFCYAVLALENVFDAFKVDIDTIVSKKALGSLAWYAALAKEFQLGDNVVIDPETYSVGYPSVSPDKQIITASAAVEETNSSITIKVAKGVVGAYQALTATEKSQFTAYFEKVKIAGSKINYVSLAADMLRIGSANIYYDSIYDVAVVTASFKKAVDSYLSSLDFNGKINVNDFIAYVKANAVGVKDFTITTISSYQNATNTAIVREYNFVAGYALYDQANSVITYNAL